MMSKLWLAGLVCLVACIQLGVSADLTETLNVQIREQLKGYEKFLAEDDGSHKADLKKLIEITESALKANTMEEKENILKNTADNFSPEFNQYVSLKLEEFHVNDDIYNAIQFYKQFLNNEAHKGEIEKTIAALESMLNETDLKVKEDKFLSLSKDFSPDFAKFLQENSLPQINRELQRLSDFFDNLLVEDGLKWKNEITELKNQAQAGITSKSIDDKQKALFEITNPKNTEFYDYLHQKFIENQ